MAAGRINIKIKLILKDAKLLSNDFLIAPYYHSEIQFLSQESTRRCGNLLKYTEYTWQN